jgi:hypothetical protein
VVVSMETGKTASEIDSYSGKISSEFCAILTSLTSANLKLHKQQINHRGLRSPALSRLRFPTNYDRRYRLAS